MTTEISSPYIGPPIEITRVARRCILALIFRHYAPIARIRFIGSSHA
jgi:hypothetical protein